jgi:hypothetical protein
MYLKYNQRRRITMKALIVLTALLTTVSCAPLAVTSIGVVTGVALTTNEPAVKEFGDKYLKAE